MNIPCKRRYRVSCCSERVLITRQQDTCQLSTAAQASVQSQLTNYQVSWNKDKKLHLLMSERRIWFNSSGLYMSVLIYFCTVLYCTALYCTTFLLSNCTITGCRTNQLGRSIDDFKLSDVLRVDIKPSSLHSISHSSRIYKTERVPS